MSKFTDLMEANNELHNNNPVAHTVITTALTTVAIVGISKLAEKVGKNYVRSYTEK
jgi:hypothetical protein